MQQIQKENVHPTKISDGVHVAPGRKHYNKVYFSSSSSDDEVLTSFSQPLVSNRKEMQQIEKEIVHPTKICDGVIYLI